MLQAKRRLAGICRSCFRFEEFKGLSIARPSHKIWGLEVRNLSGAPVPFRRPRDPCDREISRVWDFSKSRGESWPRDRFVGGRTLHFVGDVDVTGIVGHCGATILPPNFFRCRCCAARKARSIMRAKGGAFPPSFFVVPAELRRLYSAYIFQNGNFISQVGCTSAVSRKKKSIPRKSGTGTPTSRAHCPFNLVRA